MVSTLTDSVILAETFDQDGISAILLIDGDYYLATGKRLRGDVHPPAFDMRFLHVDSTRSNPDVKNGLIVALSYKDMRFELEAAVDFIGISDDAVLSDSFRPDELRKRFMASGALYPPDGTPAQSALNWLFTQLQTGSLVFNTAYEQWMVDTQDPYGNDTSRYIRLSSFSVAWAAIDGVMQKQ